jgi:hypothetical protein
VQAVEAENAQPSNRNAQSRDPSDRFHRLNEPFNGAPSVIQDIEDSFDWERAKQHSVDDSMLGKPSAWIIAKEDTMAARFFISSSFVRNISQGTPNSQGVGVDREPLGHLETS